VLSVHPLQPFNFTVSAAFSSSQQSTNASPGSDHLSTFSSSALPVFTPLAHTAKLKSMKQFTLEYWTDDGWFVGRLKEMPAVMSQGETLDELQKMIRDAYQLMVEDASKDTFVPKERHEMAISL
jgi:predicted RNase H-like HicB family nuclease